MKPFLFIIYMYHFIKAWTKYVNVLIENYLMIKCKTIPKKRKKYLSKCLDNLTKNDNCFFTLIKSMPIYGSLRIIISSSRQYEFKKKKRFVPNRPFKLMSLGKTIKKSDQGHYNLFLTFFLFWVFCFVVVGVLLFDSEMCYHERNTNVN